MRHSILFAASLCALPAFSQDAQDEQAFLWECKEGLSGDATSMLCREPRLTRGDDSISARSATFSDTDNDGTLWELTGELSVSLANAELTGERGIFELDGDEQLLRAEILGQPVAWNDFDAENDTVFSGTADTIEIDNETTTFRLLGRTILSRRTGERAPDDFEGCDWIYNWTDHTLGAGTQICGVRGVIPLPRNNQNAESASGPR